MNTNYNYDYLDEWWNPDPAPNKRRNQSKSATNSMRSSPPVTIFNNFTQTEIEDIKIILPITKKSFLNQTTTTTNNKQKTVGRTSLMLCSLIQDQEWAFTIMQNLIEKGAYIHQQDSNGHNALMYTCLYQRPSLLELMLKASGDSHLYDKDIFGNTIFHLASVCSKTDLMCTILNETYTKYQTDVRFKMMRNHLGHTPYDLCKINGHEYCINNLYPINEESGEQPQPQINLEENKNISLIATILSIAEPLKTEEEKSKQQQQPPTRKQAKLPTKEKLADYYKPLFKLKEPLIKKNTLYFDKDILEQKKNYINIPKSARNSAKTDIQLITYRLIEANKEDMLLQRYKNSLNEKSPSKSCSRNSTTTTTATTQSSNWKTNMKKILDVLELNKTKSYRATNKNLSTNLFDQIANGILKSSQMHSDSASRRNSLFRKQNTSSAMSNDGGGGGGRRQSIVSSVGKLSKPASRRPSVTV